MILWIAQGFGVGRIPVAPGTFGSVVGIAWTALLLLPGNLAVFVAGTLAGLALSVYSCGRAEQILGQTDPGSVVMDEIAALPVCFSAWIAVAAGKLGHFPMAQDLFSGPNLWWVAGVFAAFRVFDVAKPWPVHGSQALPGGWGVTTDDFLAAIYVNLAALLVFALAGWQRLV
jgi:phosphatidylglycerophosphatase A